MNSWEFISGWLRLKVFRHTPVYVDRPEEVFNELRKGEVPRSRLPCKGTIDVRTGKSTVKLLPKVNSLILPASPGIFERSVTAAKEARAPPREWP